MIIFSNLLKVLPKRQSENASSSLIVWTSLVLDGDSACSFLLVHADNPVYVTILGELQIPNKKGTIFFF